MNHPVLAAWFAIGFIDLLINIGWAIQVRLQTGGSILAEVQRRTGMLWPSAVAIGLGLTFLGGPLSLAHTIYLVPKNMEAIRRRKKSLEREQELDERAHKNAHDRGDLLEEIARCKHAATVPIVRTYPDHGSESGHFCSYCGSLYLGDFWHRPEFAQRAEELEDEADAIDEAP